MTKEDTEVPWVHEDPRLKHERQSLEADYLQRRAAMYRLAIIQGIIVVLCLLAMFIGLIALNSSIDTTSSQREKQLRCTDALIIAQIHNRHGIPSACVGQLP